MSDASERERIRHLLDFGRHDEAEERARALVAADPTDVEALLLLGTALAQLNRAEEALAPARSALALAPEATEPHLLVCEVLAQLRRGEEALPVAEQVIATDPHDWRTYFVHAQALTTLRMPRIREALESLDRAIMLNPNAAELHAYAGLLLEALGLRDQARSAHERALAIDPENTTALAGMSGLDGDFLRPKASADGIRSALGTDSGAELAHDRLEALVVGLAARLLLALAAGLMVVGLMVNAQASWTLRAMVGGLALLGTGWLARSSLTHLPSGMARSGAGLWSALRTGPKVMLVLAAAMAGCLAVMAFGPLGAGGDVGLLFVRAVQVALLVGIVSGVLSAVVSLARRRD